MPSSTVLSLVNIKAHNCLSLFFFQLSLIFLFIKSCITSLLAHHNLPLHTQMGTCCSSIPALGDAYLDGCIDGHNKSTPIFEESADSPRCKTAPRKVEANKSIEPKKCLHKPKNKESKNRLPSIERPSQLKLARGHQPKVKIDQEKIMQNIRMKMLLCSEVALIGTGGKTENSIKLAPKGTSHGKLNVDLKKSLAKHKGSTAKITKVKSSVRSTTTMEATESSGFSLDKSPTSSTITQVDDEV